MSYKVTEEILDKAAARYGARNVLCALAEVAHHDGVAFGLRQAWKDEPGDPRERNTIAWRAGLERRQVQRCLQRLQWLDELEVVFARNGRRRFYVYRIIVGRLRSLPVDYGRDGLPSFEVERPFWTPEQLALPMEDRPAEGHFVPWETDSRGDKMSPRQDGDQGLDPASDGASSAPGSGRHLRPDRGDIDVAPTDSSKDPSEVPSLEEGVVAAAEERKTSSGVGVPLVASYDPDPAAAVEAPRESEVARVVAGLRGSDRGSLGVVLPRALQLTAQVFADVVEKLGRRKARNPVGMLNHLLDVAIAEHRLALTLVEGGEQPRSALQRLKAEQPERFLEAMACHYDERDLEEFLVTLPVDRHDACRRAWTDSRERIGQGLSARPLWMVAGLAHPGWATAEGRKQWAIDEGALLEPEHAELIVAEARAERDDIDEDEAAELLELAAAAREQLLAADERAA